MCRHEGQAGGVPRCAAQMQSAVHGSWSADDGGQARRPRMASCGALTRVRSDWGGRRGRRADRYSPTGSDRERGGLAG
jgi:hypothetical protein